MMKDIVYALKEIINKYPNVLNDDKKLKSILKDYFPEDKRIQNQLFMVVDEGIIEDLNGVTVIKKFKMLGYIHALSDDYGISETMAKDVVMIWINALGLTAEEVHIEDSSNNKKIKREDGVIDYSNMSLEDLEVSGSVVKLSGVGERIFPKILLSGGTYVVKASKRLAAKYYDYEKNYTYIIGLKTEDIWKPQSSIKFDKPGIIQVTNVEGDWNIEMIPI